ncbi:hypothetical protein HQ865_03215 [Mucilaginibacter mali]|uniref:Uncharacterized protein n=1 Tax=Mucilaginibacter mali TaxID=2740462 RepID=A0A7D4PS77_9SPHI|nr:hypothetical protein [Mucilaginibacter mali]QKJ28808.1 hypothetical protein HQ865_03215 [Mucilaginibacter mali]
MNIIPFQSVGDLNFTDERHVLRGKIDGEYQPGMNEFEGHTEYYDFFPEVDMLIYYDADDRVNAFEFFSQGPEYRDIDLLSETYADLLKLFKVFDPELIIEEDNFESAKAGIVVNATEPDDLPESVLVYREGYYE